MEAQSATRIQMQALRWEARSAAQRNGYVLNDTHRLFESIRVLPPTDAIWTRQEAWGRTFDSFYQANKTWLLDDEDPLRSFSLEYLRRDFRFVPVLIEEQPEGNLVGLSEHGGIAPFLGSIRLKDNPRLVIGLDEDNFEHPIQIASLLTDRGTFLSWSGDATIYGGQRALPILFSAANSARGCTIKINSEPGQATVYFNDDNSPYYRATNTSSVRDAGHWKVRLVLEGYEEWVDERTMGAGDSWTINAVLKKKQP